MRPPLKFLMAGYAYPVGARFIRGGLEFEEGWSWRAAKGMESGGEGPGYNIEEVEFTHGDQTGTYTVRNRTHANGDPSRYQRQLYLWPKGETNNTVHVGLEKNRIIVPPKNHPLNDWLYQGERYPVVWVNEMIREKHMELCDHHSINTYPTGFHKWTNFAVHRKGSSRFFLCQSDDDAAELLTFMRLRY